MRTFLSIFSLSILAIIISYLLGCFYAYSYPMKYKSEIENYSSDYGVKSALIASVANVESNFNESALSNKGAIGIMQLLPSTAEWLAEKLNENYSEEMLYNGEYNLKLGSYYLAYLIKYFKDEELGICAYNAGQGKVKEWLADKQYSSDGKNLNLIPYKETADYLNKVSKNYKYYKNRYK